MATVEKFIRVKYIIAGVQEYINDIQELETADPRLVVQDVLMYIGLTDEMIREAVGEAAYNKTIEPLNVEVKDVYHQA